ncbi:Mo-co oxidoreductase dimerization domain protein [compost metagenome]
MRGIAWSGNGKITRVDVSIDGGRNWYEAKLQEPVLNKSLTAFRAPFEWSGAEMVIMSRAIDETGYVQPSLEQLKKVRGEVSFYHNNATQPWRINSNGEVTNGRS